MAEQAMSVEERISDFLRVEEEGEAPHPETEAAKPEPQPEEVNEEPAQDSEVEEAPTAEKEESPSGEDVEELNISSFNELAEHLGIDIADMYQLAVPINTPEGRKEITLGEWKDSVQASEQLKAERAKLSEIAEQREAELRNFSESIQHSMTQANAVVQMAEHELMRDYQSVNWQELREYDPAEFAAKQQEFGQRQNQIQQAKQNALQQMQMAQQQQMMMLQESLPEQQKALTKLIPSWENESTASAEKAKVAEFLVKAGFKPDEVNNLYDARAVALAYKAMKYDELKSEKTPAKNKVLKIGKKPIKPGKAQSKSEKRESANRDQRVRLKKSGDVKDLAALLNTDEFLGDM